MRGYVVAKQWYYGIKTYDELVDPLRHTGDAAAVDMLLGPGKYPILSAMPPCDIGEIVFRVEDDGTLTQVKANVDSSG